MLSTVLLVLLILALVGAFTPNFGYSRYGWGPWGVVIVILLLLLLFGHFGNPLVIHD
jgi:hypothetical protein